MKIYVVSTLSGVVIGAYTKLTKAQAKQEYWRRSYSQNAIITSVEVNKDESQDET